MMLGSFTDPARETTRKADSSLAFERTPGDLTARVRALRLEVVREWCAGTR
jgi:hypothetical protein